MTGAINYLREVQKICTENHGDCKSCLLGKQEKLKDTLCPRLTHPQSWTDEKSTAMVRAV